MDKPAERAAMQIAGELASRKSVEIKLQAKIFPLGDFVKRPQTVEVMKIHYIETADGKRFWDDLGLGGGKPTYRSTHFRDGSKCADVNYNREDTTRQQTVTIQREFWMEAKNDRRQLPPTLLHLYVGRESLDEALPKAKSLGAGEVIGRECDIFLFEKVRWAVTQDQVFYLDRETATPLKVEAYHDEPSRQAKQPMWVWAATSLDRVQGHPVVLKSTEAASGPDGTPVARWEFEVESIEFGREYPASTFWPTIQPGVGVWDSIKAKAYQAPGKREEPAIPKEITESTAAPMSADPPSDWSGIASRAQLWVRRRHPGRRRFHVAARASDPFLTLRRSLVLRVDSRFSRRGEGGWRYLSSRRGRKHDRM